MSSSSRTLLCAPSMPSRYRPREAAVGAAVDVARGDGHAVGVLLDADDLVPVEHARAGLGGARAQDRLQARLADEQAAARAQRLDPFVQAGDEPGELAARETCP